MNDYGDPIWRTIFLNKKWGEYPAEEMVRFIMYAKNYINKKEVACLDIGCGIGACIWCIAKEIGKVTAMEGTKSALDKVKRLCRKMNIDLENIDICHGDITFPKDYLNHSFDILVDNYSLYANLASHIRQAYIQYYHLLKEEGLFITNCFGKNTTGFNTGQKIEDNTFINLEKGTLKNKGKTTFWDRKELNEMFEKTGYRIVNIENIIENRNNVIIEKHINLFNKII